MLRLKKHAEPFVDTVDSVVNRALDALEANDGGGGEDERYYLDCAAPPNLTFTTVVDAVIGGRRLPRGQNYWNLILLEAVRRAGSAMEPEDVKNLIVGNVVLGLKDDQGYKFIPEAAVSVQGMDANGAWRAAYGVMRSLGLAFEINFRWQENPKAAHPGVYAAFSSEYPSGGGRNSNVFR
jgi:hypothetical protein